MLTEAQRKEEWKKLCDKIDQKIRAEHAPMKNDSDFSWHALKGWLTNWWERPTTKYDVNTYSMMAGSRGVTYFISSVPLLGTLINALSDAYTAMVNRKQMESDLRYDPKNHQLAGTLLATSAMQSYVDAVRKLEKASTEYNAMRADMVCNCDTYVEKLARFYYWKYRLERLLHYHKIAAGFCEKTEQFLKQSTEAFKQQELKLNQNAPNDKIFTDWTWHRYRCREICVFPWKSLDITGPSNVKVNKQAGPRTMVKNVPTGANNPE